MIEAEIPIRAYKIVHTGPNTHEGGAMDGLCNLPYQVGIDLEVKSDPAIPTVSHIPMYFNMFTQFESIFSSRDMRAAKEMPLLITIVRIFL
jgi:hypothetical protein